MNTKRSSALVLALLGSAGVVLAQGESIDARPPRKPPSAEQWVSHLDQDQDGRVSAEEFDGPAEHFAKLDQNGDGYLGVSEAPKPRGFIERLDKDHDGRISAEEFDGPAEHFAKLDRDQDGYISQEEAPKGPPPRGHRPPPPPRQDG